MVDLRITHAEAGLMMTVFSLPGAFALPIGLLSDRYDTRRLGVISLFLLSVGSFVVATSPTFTATLAGRLIGGIGSTTISVIAPAIIAQWFPRNELGTAMGVYGTGLPIAVTLSFILLSQLGILYSWRTPFYLSTMSSLIMLAVFSYFLGQAHGIKRMGRDNSALSPSVILDLRNREVWKMGLCFLLFMAGWTSFTTWAPTLLSNYKGVSLSNAGFLASLPMIVSLFCMPPLGWVSDRLGKRKSLVMVGSAVTTSLLLIIPGISEWALVVSFVMMGIAFALVPPAVFGLSGETLGPGSTGTSFGVLIMCSNLGMASPVLPGLIQDMTSSLQLTLASMAILTGSSFILAYFLRTR